LRKLVIIPAYNEEKNIEKVIVNLKEKEPSIDYLIVNDCSKDGTVNICNVNNYNYLDLPVNLGIGGAVQTGYKYAYQNGYDIVIQHDGDGQHDPSYIKNILEPIESGKADIVIGSRFITGEGYQSSRIRRFGINFLSKLIRMCSGADVKDVTSGYRAVDKKFIEIYAKDYAQDYPEPEALVAAAMHGAKIIEVPVIMYKREEGQSSINAYESMYYMIKVSIAILLYRITFNKKERYNR